MTRKQYSGEFKEKVCEDYLSTDMTYEEIAGKYERQKILLSPFFDPHTSAPGEATGYDFSRNIRENTLFAVQSAALLNGGDG